MNSATHVPPPLKYEYRYLGLALALRPGKGLARNLSEATLRYLRARRRIFFLNKRRRACSCHPPPRINHRNYRESSDLIILTLLNPPPTTQHRQPPLRHCTERPLHPCRHHRIAHAKPGSFTLASSPHRRSELGQVTGPRCPATSRLSNWRTSDPSLSARHRKLWPRWPSQMRSPSRTMSACHAPTLPRSRPRWSRVEVRPRVKSKSADSWTAAAMNPYRRTSPWYRTW